MNKPRLGEDDALGRRRLGIWIDASCTARAEHDHQEEDEEKQDNQADRTCASHRSSGLSG